MIGVRVDDQRHAGLEDQVDLLEHRRPPVHIEPQTVAAYARVLRRHILAETVASKYFVLRARDLSRRRSGAHGGDTGFECLVVYSEGALLRLARPSTHGVSSVVTRSPATRRRSVGGCMPRTSLPPEPRI